ncbi:MAG: type II secretion system protein GspC [Polyangia bacterium]
METLLRKYLWALDLAVVALCATFLGNAASSAVESKVVAAIPAPAPVASKPRRPEPTTASSSKQPDGILKRNIFCSTCPPIIDEPHPDGGAIDPSTEPVKTTLPLALLAIMYAPPPNGIKWSIAVIRDTEIKSMGAFPVGGKIHGATVIEIQETRIYLDNAGKTEFLDLFEKPAPPVPPVASAAGGTDPLSIEMDKGIKKTGEHSFEIQRGTLESVLGNMSLLSRSARIVPEMRDGKAAGFRLYAVKPDGPFAKIGMQNGDVISSINGLEITSPEKALEVYSKLKSASHLSLGMESNGKKVTQDYNIR